MLALFLHIALVASQGPPAITRHWAPGTFISCTILDSNAINSWYSKDNTTNQAEHSRARTSPALQFYKTRLFTVTLKTAQGKHCNTNQRCAKNEELERRREFSFAGISGVCTSLCKLEVIFCSRHDLIYALTMLNQHGRGFILVLVLWCKKPWEEE